MVLKVEHVLCYGQFCSLLPPPPIAFCNYVERVSVLALMPVGNVRFLCRSGSVVAVAAFSFSSLACLIIVRRRRRGFLCSSFSTYWSFIHSSGRRTLLLSLTFVLYSFIVVVDVAVILSL